MDSFVRGSTPQRTKGRAGGRNPPRARGNEGLKARDYRLAAM